MSRAAATPEPFRGVEPLQAADVGEAASAVRARCVALLHQAGVKGARKIDDEDELVADLGLESIQVLRLITLVEREFELQIDIHDLTGVKTVADLLGFVRTRLDADSALRTPPTDGPRAQGCSNTRTSWITMS